MLWFGSHTWFFTLTCTEAQNAMQRSRKKRSLGPWWWEGWENFWTSSGTLDLQKWPPQMLQEDEVRAKKEEPGGLGKASNQRILTLVLWSQPIWKKNIKNDFFFWKASHPMFDNPVFHDQMLFFFVKKPESEGRSWEKENCRCWWGNGGGQKLGRHHKKHVYSSRSFVIWVIRNKTCDGEALNPMALDVKVPIWTLFRIDTFHHHQLRQRKFQEKSRRCGCLKLWEKKVTGSGSKSKVEERKPLEAVNYLSHPPLGKQTHCRETFSDGQDKTKCWHCGKKPPPERTASSCLWLTAPARVNRPNDDVTMLSGAGC